MVPGIKCSCVPIHLVLFLVPFSHIILSCSLIWFTMWHDPYMWIPCAIALFPRVIFPCVGSSYTIRCNVHCPMSLCLSPPLFLSTVPSYHVLCPKFPCALPPCIASSDMSNMRHTPWDWLYYFMFPYVMVPSITGPAPSLLVLCFLTATPTFLFWRSNSLKNEFPIIMNNFSPLRFSLIIWNDYVGFAYSCRNCTSDCCTNSKSWV